MAKTISELIKSDKFVSVQLKAMLGLFLAANQIESKQQVFFKEYGITQQQYNVLRILRGHYPKSYGILQIQDRMLDKMSDVSRIVERLRKIDLVKREVNPENRRAVNVVISNKGLQLLSQIDDNFDDIQGLVNLNNEEANTLITLIEKILD